MFKLCSDKWGSRSRGWRNSRIEGLVILASKRHIKCFDDLNEREKVDYINLLTKIRKAQREVLGSNTFIISTMRILLTIFMLGWFLDMNGCTSLDVR